MSMEKCTKKGKRRKEKKRGERSRDLGGWEVYSVYIYIYVYKMNIYTYVHTHMYNEDFSTI